MIWFRRGRENLLIAVFLAGLTIFSGESSVNFCLALDKDFMYDTAQSRDPFLPLIGQNVKLADMEEVRLENLTLEGIIFDPMQGSLAIINGDVYKISDFISGFEIKEISEDQIRVSKDDVLYTIKLPSEDV